MEDSHIEAPEPIEDSNFERVQVALVKGAQNRFFWPAMVAVVLVIALVVSLLEALNRSSDEDSATMETETFTTPMPTESEIVRIDSDNDGLFDDQEIEGWRTKDGSVYKTDPFSADTDGDGLTDMEEAGQLITEVGSKELTYQGEANPLKVDSDDDGLDDKTEVEVWLDTEGKQYKTNPLRAGTDGDGLN